MDSGGVAGIVIAVVALLCLWVAWLSVYIVHQAEGIVIERFGRFHRVLKPGLNCIVPFMDAPRVFTWRKTYVDVSKKVRDETITASRVDLREALFDFVKQDVYSKDTVLLEVNCFMLYRVVDVRKAIYEVDDLAQAVSYVPPPPPPPLAMTTHPHHNHTHTHTRTHARARRTQRHGAVAAEAPVWRHDVCRGAGEPGDDQRVDARGRVADVRKVGPARGAH